MAGNEEAELLVLMGIDANAVRTYHVFSLLEQAISGQRKSSIDALFGIVTGFVAIIDLVSFVQVPNTAPYVLVLSLVLVLGAGYLWSRHRAKEYESLGLVRKFGMYLDQMRRSFRQLNVAEALSKRTPELEAIKASILASLKGSLEGLSAIQADIAEIDYYTLGEGKTEVAQEMKKALAALSGRSSPQ